MTNVFTSELAPEPYLIDTFGRLRVSTPISELTIAQNSPSFNSLCTFGPEDGQNQTVGVVGQRIPSPVNDGSSIISSEGLSPSFPGIKYRLRTRVPGLYQAGKSLLITMTFNMISLEQSSTGITKRVGYFYEPNGGNRDGIFLEQADDGEWYFVLSNNGVETRVIQSSWNRDIFDGNGKGIALDKTKAHIVFFGIEWLGVGDVFCGFIQDGEPKFAHQFKNTNNLDSTYMRSANLFPTYEIETGSSNNINVQMRTICATVQSEGGVDKYGLTYSVAKQLSGGTSTGNRYAYRPFIVFRLKQDRLNARIRPVSWGISISSNTYFYVALVRNPLFNESYTFTPVNDTSDVPYEIDYPTTANFSLTTPSYSGGVNTDINNIYLWHGSGNQTNDQSITDIDIVDYMGSNAANLPELWCLAIACYNSNETIRTGYINFFEQL